MTAADPTAASPGDPTLVELVTDDVPGQHQLGPVVERFDEWVDRALDRIRGNPVADRVFTAASFVGDFSLIWHSIAITRGIARRKPREILVFAAVLGAESLIVNQGIKRLFKRTRPTTAGEAGLHVRHPSTSSFPSGHASSAAFASTLLAAHSSRRLAALWYVLASIVGTSRAYVRIHHASDVVAGFVTGRALAWVARQGLRRFGIDRLL